MEVRLGLDPSTTTTSRMLLAERRAPPFVAVADETSDAAARQDAQRSSAPSRTHQRPGERPGGLLLPIDRAPPSNRQVAQRSQERGRRVGRGFSSNPANQRGSLPYLRRPRDQTLNRTGYDGAAKGVTVSALR